MNKTILILNSMVPVKGIILFNLVYLSHLLFSIYMVFGKCKYCSLVLFLFFVDFRPLMKPRGERAEVQID